MLADRGFPNHGEQPRLEAGFTSITRFAFKDLQVNRLQNLFRFRRVATTATERPAETGAMEPFQLILQL